MLQSHEAVNACGGRVRCAGGGEGDYGGEGGQRVGHGVEVIVGIGVAVDVVVDVGVDVFTYPISGSDVIDFKTFKLPLVRKS